MLDPTIPPPMMMTSADFKRAQTPDLYLRINAGGGDRTQCYDGWLRTIGCEASPGIVFRRGALRAKASARILESQPRSAGRAQLLSVRRPFSGPAGPRARDRFPNWH